MSIRVISPGLLTSLQDEGRWGYQEFGFSPSGALDLRALREGNLLLGNAPGEAALEMNLLGATLAFDEPCAVAITGAAMSPLLNGAAIPMYAAVCVSPGDVLTCGAVSGGLCSYLCVSGGFAAEAVMGSLSTGMKFSVGGFAGRKLAANDLLPLRSPGRLPPKPETRVSAAPEYTREVTLRAIRGPQDFLFSDETLARFFSQPYTVSNLFDRMGVRLEGEPLLPKKSCDIVSDGTVNGAVQIPSGGLPILLRNDRQTTGGYAKIACVITTDLPVMAQLTAGAVVRFQEITPRRAQRLAAKAERDYLRRYRKMNGGLSWN